MWWNERFYCGKLPSDLHKYAVTLQTPLTKLIKMCKQKLKVKTIILSFKIDYLYYIEKLLFANIKGKKQ